MRARETIEFGEFKLDLHRYELCQRGHALRLERLAVELLVLLIENDGAVVSRPAIADRLWGKDVFVATDDSINSAINKIRAALRDDPAAPQYIQTVKGKGYRFIADVKIVRTPEGESLASGAKPGVTAELETPSERHNAPRPDLEPILTPAPFSLEREKLSSVPEALNGSNKDSISAVRKRTTFRRWTWVLLSLTALCSVGWVLLVRHRARSFSPAEGSAAPEIQSIAVLPLASLTQDPSQEYLVDGMTDELITNLSRATPIRVISRTSIMQYKGVRRPLPEIAKALNVDAVVEGSVLRSGGNVRITVQLLNARQDRHLWAHTYQVSENDIVALQDTVAHDVATQVAAELKPASTAGSSATSDQHVSFPAYEDYLRGRYIWNKRTAETATTAVEYFERAIAAEPRYALAYAGLADAYLEIYGFRLMSKQEGLTKAKTAALRALELDPSLAAAHTTLASIAFAGWDWTNAEREFKQAISLSPGYATAHEWYSIFLSTVGRHDQALSEATQAAQLDPLSPMIHANIGLVLLMARRYEEAAILLRRVVETTPEIGAPHLWLAVVYERQGRFAESAAEYERSAQLSQEPERSWIQGSAYAVAGKKIEAERMLSKAETLAKQLGTPGTNVAFAYLDLQLGKNEEAVEFLEKAYIDRDNDLADIKENLICDPLRAEPRFQEIVRRMAFPER